MATTTGIGLFLALIGLRNAGWVTDSPATLVQLWAFDFPRVLMGKFLTVVLAFLFVDVFDTAGSLLGMGRIGGFLKPNGELTGAGRGFMADAVGTMAGAAFGTSTGWRPFLQWRRRPCWWWWAP
ncbi:solute carrier family 23 protein [Archangium violaceum]|uniref:Uncharacterized protein n=1 Tax=Archangium violaceum Cb vi76 TaxID=1406225 RepID=A0A084SRG0_9BACT|nr:solute carrier family 23 protein [Archangium violaceum]KFA91045.1 hypothetical protein Q664_24660 [Archangium violaceum Cb vi76]